MTFIKKLPKNLKLLAFNLKGIGSILSPNFFYQRKLNSLLKELLDHKELESIKTRANYYNKIKKPFKFNQKQGYKLSSKPFKKAAYSFDLYKVGRYFDDGFLVLKEFGDIRANFNAPTLCKSRSLNDENYNNILLKLDSNRHFSLYQDKLNFNQKNDKAIFRGACYQSLRQNFLQLHQNNPKCNIKDTSNKASKQYFLSPYDQMKYKFIISLEGNDVASNLKWAMNSNSLVMAPKMTCETWFMEKCLKPNEHFALLDDDFSNLDELIDHYLSQPKEAEAIIKNAHSYMQEFLNPKKELFISILVLLKYLYYSDQLELDKEILELFE